MVKINVVKRNGGKEELNIDKIHKVCTWACEDITGVSISEVELKSQLQFFNNITTKEIHETLIMAASELISEDTPNYQYVAGRLINYQLRKEVYGKFIPDTLKDHYERVSKAGYYNDYLGKVYSDEDFKKLEKIIDHDRDNNLTFCAMEQFRGKYLVKNRTTGEFFETPQMTYMFIAMTLFANYPKETRLKWVKDLYDSLSNFDISFPTPIMAGARTPDEQFSSCVLIESDDNLDSIFTTATSIGKYVSQKAGIGIGAGRIRGVGSSVNGGRVSHTGVIPFYRLFQSAVKSCSQGGVRNGAATLHVPLWHSEIEDIFVLKNNKGTEMTRLRQMDYSIQFNKTMYERLISGGNITLFSPSDVPGLYEAFFTDEEEFKKLYEKYERSTKIKKKTVSAVDLFSDFMKERKDTGRIYFQNVDHCNTHSSFKVPIYMSNLCQEITLPTKPLKSVDDEEGEIALCILAAINWGKIKKPEDFEKPCELAVRALNAVIDMQSYPVKAAELSTLKRRSIGVGIINFAYWLAKNNMSYTDCDYELLHEYCEAWSYYLIKASIDMAEERGACSGNDETKYSDGIFPVDTYKKDVDEIVKPVYKQDWDALRVRAKEHGILNSTLMALMPSETSAQISNSTNGIEPPRGLVSYKQSKHGVLKQVVPEIQRLKNKYELLWDQQSPVGYIKIVAVMQKFIDQSISTNTSYNPKFYTEEQIPMSTMLQDLLMMYKYGLKTGYYFNTFDSAGELEVSDVESDLADIEDEECESCVI